MFHKMRDVSPNACTDVYVMSSCKRDMAGHTHHWRSETSRAQIKEREHQSAAGERDGRAN